MRLLNISRRSVLAIVVGCIALGGIATVLVWQLARPAIYQCEDIRTKAPVFIKIANDGQAHAVAHDTDGQIYDFSGRINSYYNYSRFSDEEVFYRTDSARKDIVWLGRQTGSFSITDSEGELLYSGICKL